MTNLLAEKIQFDACDLEQRIKEMYTDVAQNPNGDYHFEMGRTMAERLGYSPAILQRVPAAAIDSFAGVGHHFDLAAIEIGDHIVDLGSGSGMDSFYASILTGGTGKVSGIDMTPAQLAKASALGTQNGFTNIDFNAGYIEHTGIADASVDVVISNGVINLVPDKHAVFKEAARLLKPGGRLAISDIVTEKRLPENITCDAALWAACIGGALSIRDYLDAIAAAELELFYVQTNTGYRFLSDGAQWATQTYGVKSISLVAHKK